MSYNRKIEKQEFLYLQAYKNIKEDLINGCFTPKQKITNTYLAETYGISRTPAREAIRMLSNEGLLVKNGNDISVFEPSLSDIGEIYIIRSKLESLAVAFLALDANKNKKIAFLNSYIDKDECNYNNENTKFFTKKIENNTNFHRNLVKLCNFDTLIKAYEIIDLKMYLLRHYTLKKFKTYEIAIHEHKKILELINEGKAFEGMKMIERHILNAAQRALEEFKRKSSPSIKEKKKVIKYENYIKTILKNVNLF